MIIPILQMVLGLALILLGRKLFWFFVAAMGFVSGIELATLLFPSHSRWLVLLIALLAGAVGALLAVFLQKLAVGLAGFLGGGYLTLKVLVMFGWETERYVWLALFVGGVLGTVLVIFLFDWALIFLSSLIGATLFVQALYLSPALTALFIAALFILGVVVQAGRRKKESKAVYS